MKTFNDFDLSPKLRASLEELQFTTPTPIQEKCIPAVQQGIDVIGCAATGTGKTLAFALPLIGKAEKHLGKTQLILCPVRELAVQIEAVFRELLDNNSQIKTCLVMGGASMGLQIRNLRTRPHIIIGTPGRMVDHLKHGTLSLDTVETVVLDEADRMLDIGFAPQIEKILKVVPPQRQIVLFSATFPAETQKLAARIMHNPQKISVGENSRPPELVSQSSIDTTQHTKNSQLLDVLNAREGSILIFARTKHRTDRLYTYLTEYGYSVSRIHGGRSQAQRSLAMRGFREGKFRILVATDVAARGIDVSNVAYVINYDLPQTPEDYVHRIGRSGRAGVKGHAISFLTPDDKGLWYDINRFIAGETNVSFAPNYKKRSPSSEDRSHKGEGRSFKKDSRGSFKGGGRFKKDDRGFKGEGRSFKKDDRSYKSAERSFKKDDRGFKGEGRSFKKDDRSYKSAERSFKKDDRGFNGENRTDGFDKFRKENFKNKKQGSNDQGSDRSYEHRKSADSRGRFKDKDQRDEGFKSRRPQRAWKSSQSSY